MTPTTAAQTPGLGSAVFMRVWQLLAICVLAYPVEAKETNYRFREPPQGPAVAFSATVLNAEERAYITALPEVRVGMALPPFVPYEVISADGEVAGIHPEMLMSLARAFGFRLKPVVFANWSEVIQAAERREVDLLMSVGIVAKRTQYLEFTRGATPMVSAVFGRKGSVGAEEGLSLEHARYALERGNISVDFVSRRFPQAPVEVVDDSGQALQKVMSGEADFYVGNLLPTMDRIAKNGIQGVEVNRLVAYGSGYYHFAVRKDWAPLAAIINKGLSSIRQSTSPQLKAVYETLPTGLAPPSTKVLSSVQQAVLNERPVWRVGAVRGLSFLNDVDVNGGHNGIAAEYVETVARQLGIGLQLTPFDSVGAMLDALRAGSIDVVPFLTRTADRNRDFVFSAPYVEMPYMIVARSDAPLYWDLASLQGKRLALAPQHPLREVLARRYPQVQVVDAASGTEAMNAVARGEADAAVEVKLFANLRINGDNDGRLRAVAMVEDLPAQFRFATSREAGVLVPIIDEVLAEISPGERDRMLRRWVAIDLKPEFPWRRYLPAMTAVGVGLLLLGLVTVWWMRRLQREVAARRRSEEQLQDISATLPCMAYRVILELDGRLRSAFYSSAAEALLGVVPDARRTLLDNLDRRLAPEDLQAARLATEQAVRRGEGLKLTGRYEHPDGRPRWLHTEVVSKTLPDGATALTGFVADVTHERELQAQLTQEAEGRHLFLASASHELRAPTHTLTLALQAVMSHTGDADAHLRVALDATHTLRQLIDDVLDAARLDQGEMKLRPQVFKPRELLDDIAASIQPWAAERGLRLETVFSDSLPSAAMLDPLRLRQVLTNLLSNALKYTAAGHVRFEAHMDTSASHSMLRLIVSDTGIGIDPVRLERLFQPYVEAGNGSAQSAPSTGLGLNICRRLLDLMGGTITIHSKPGQGTRAEVAIPLPQAPPRSSQDLILLCDDDDTSRLLMAQMLSSRGYRVAEAASGEAAWARWLLGDVGALITDIEMGGIHGDALIRRIRQAESALSLRTRILVCSGSPVPEAQVGQPAQHDAYFAKPVDIAMLSDTLSALGIRPGDGTSLASAV